jgi:hypothetical protein
MASSSTWWRSEGKIESVNALGPATARAGHM